MELTPDSLYIKYVRLKEEDETPQTYPYTVPALANFRRLEFRRPVTFIMGENGMGKSTLLEAIAVKAGFNPEGGSKNFRFATRASHSGLYEHIVLGRGLQPRDGYFLRAESFYNVATEIENVADGVLKYYGDKSLHQQSHGESFLALLGHRLFGHGLYIFDEPEAALSPSRQMYMLCRMKQLAEQGMDQEAKVIKTSWPSRGRSSSSAPTRRSSCPTPAPRYTKSRTADWNRPNWRRPPTSG